MEPSHSRSPKRGHMAETLSTLGRRYRLGRCPSIKTSTSLRFTRLSFPRSTHVTVALPSAVRFSVRLLLPAWLARWSPTPRRVPVLARHPPISAPFSIGTTNDVHTVSEGVLAEISRAGRFSGRARDYAAFSTWRFSATCSTVTSLWCFFHLSLAFLV